MTPSVPHEDHSFGGSGGSTVGKLKLKGTDGGAPPGVEFAASFDSTRENPPGPDIARGYRLIVLFLILWVVVHGRSLLLDCFVWPIPLTNETFDWKSVKDDSYLIPSLPLVHTTRRPYRLNDPVNNSEIDLISFTEHLL